MADFSGYQPQDPTLATRAVHAGKDPGKFSFAPVTTPLYTSTIYKHQTPEENQGHSYARVSNPTRTVLEELVASLDNAQHALVWPSGMSTVVACLELLFVGDHIVCEENAYSGTTRYFREFGAKHGVETTFVNSTKAEEVGRAVRPNTKMVWLESPTNPLMLIADIPAICNLVKKINNDIVIVVDNTFMTPVFQQPLKLGADIVMYSMTKYFNGHTDVLMGAITTNNEALYQKLRYFQIAGGIVPSPFDCSQVIRSVKTLPLRMEKHMKNATEVAKYLESHHLVERVFFPGCESHPQYELGKKLFKGVSGMLSFYLKGTAKNASDFVSSLKVFTLAGSLGGPESLVSIPILMTHKSLTAETQKRLGLSANLVRMSVGIESLESLIADLEQAFNSIEAQANN